MKKKHPKQERNWFERIGAKSKLPNWGGRPVPMKYRRARISKGGDVWFYKGRRVMIGLRDDGNLWLNISCKEDDFERWANSRIFEEIFTGKNFNEFKAHIDRAMEIISQPGWEKAFREEWWKKLIENVEKSEFIVSEKVK